MTRSIDQQLAYERSLYSYPEDPGIIHRELDQESYDVVIVGAGQVGTSVAAKFLSQGVDRILVIDRERRGREGPWTTWARMHALRSDKGRHGPDVGFPAATFQNWYRERHGDEAYEAMERLPKDVWAEYVQWVRDAFDVPVENETELVSLGEVREAKGAGYLPLRLRSAAGEREVLTRKLVVTTGMLGAGKARVPHIVEQLPTDRWIHSSNEYDFSKLRGRRVAVLGAGASAFDNAAVALEAGAEVVQFIRREKIPQENYLRAMEKRSIIEFHEKLPDEYKLRLIRRMQQMPVPPPKWTVERCTKHDSYELRMGTGWSDARADGDGVQLETRASDGTARTEHFDFLIVGSGFSVDVTNVPWLGDLAGSIKLWRDTGLTGDTDAERGLGSYPYLAQGMKVVSTSEAHADALGRIHLVNPAALLSSGVACSGVSTMPMALDIVTDGVLADLLLEDIEEVATWLEGYDEAEVPELHDLLAEGFK